MRVAALLFCAFVALPGFGADSKTVATGAVPAYPSPIEIAMSGNGSRLYVVCEGTDEVVELDAAAGIVVRRVRVGQHPKEHLALQ